VYLEPTGGICDIFNVLNNALSYCNNYNRILLVNGNKSTYKVNFSKYFNLSRNNVIFDTEKIMEICNNTNNTIYPEILNGKMKDILNGTIQFHYSNANEFFSYNEIELGLPQENRSEDIIIHSQSKGGNAYVLFKELIFCPDVKSICNERYNKLKKPYLCIQIRNTDYKCDYISYFNNHENEIRAFQEIYIATDDTKVIDFYKDKGLSIQNFTTFPKDNYFNLHFSNLDPHTKFIDLFCDIYIAGMSDKLMSNSKGGFIRLLRKLNENKNELYNQFI
jgi:hypothetical protein